MSFQTITVFEKDGAQIEAEIWATPGWFKFSQCFLYDNNPYVSRLEMKVNNDGSYLEYHLDFHNEDAYQAWHDEWKHIHDDLRPKIIDNLKFRGIGYTLYWPEGNISPPNEEPALAVSQFTTKLSV